MLLFVDGVDGSGKTTLIRHLATELDENGADAHVVPPLWRYLDAITTPEQFEPWVTSADGPEIAIALLNAMTGRMQHVRDQPIRASSVQLIDRGPKTVCASALAHLATRSATRGCVDSAVERLADMVNSLSATNRCHAFEFPAEPRDADILARRLKKLQPVSIPYAAYLDALRREMHSMPAWPGLPSNYLGIDDTICENVSRVMAVAFPARFGGFCSGTDE